jgi:hypothetical protein
MGFSKETKISTCVGVVVALLLVLIDPQQPVLRAVLWIIIAFCLILIAKELEWVRQQQDFELSIVRVEALPEKLSLPRLGCASLVILAAVIFFAIQTWPPKKQEAPPSVFFSPGGNPGVTSKPTEPTIPGSPVTIPAAPKTEVPKTIEKKKPTAPVQHAYDENIEENIVLWLKALKYPIEKHASGKFFVYGSITRNGTVVAVTRSTDMDQRYIVIETLVFLTVVQHDIVVRYSQEQKDRLADLLSIELTKFKIAYTLALDSPTLGTGITIQKTVPIQNISEDTFIDALDEVDKSAEATRDSLRLLIGK